MGKNILRIYDNKTWIEVTTRGDRETQDKNTFIQLRSCGKHTGATLTLAVEPLTENKGTEGKYIFLDSPRISHRHSPLQLHLSRALWPQDNHCKDREKPPLHTQGTIALGRDMMAMGGLLRCHSAGLPNHASDTAQARTPR